MSPDNLRKLRWIYPNLKSIFGHTIRPYSGLQTVVPDIKYCTFIRDPIARSISQITWNLRWKAHQGGFFDDFQVLVKDWVLATDNRNRQCRQLSAEGTFEGVKNMAENNPFLFLRVEDFDESLFLFRHWTGESRMDLSYALRNTGVDRYERLQNSQPEYLEKVRNFNNFLKEDEDMQSILAEANQEDQALADWVESDVWPKQTEAYPGNLPEEVLNLRQHLEQSPPNLNEPILARLHRNVILKPIRSVLLSGREPEEDLRSPWL